MNQKHYLVDFLHYIFEIYLRDLLQISNKGTHDQPYGIYIICACAEQE